MAVMKRLLVLAPLALCTIQCGGGASAPPITIHVAPSLAEAELWAADDLAADLGQVTRSTVKRATGPASCVDGEIHLAVLGHGADAAASAAPAPPATQGYTIHETRCGDGRLVLLRGGDLLSAQWAVYDLADRLGIRYFHPEQTLYPARLAWPAQPLEVAARGAFQRRSLHVHTTHPVELSAPLSTPLDMAAYMRRWVDWNVKLRMTSVDGWDRALIGDHAFKRGFPRGTGLNLLNTQQGGDPVLDPNDPRPESEQLTEAIERAMAPVPGLPDPVSFGFQFNPSEFTEADDVATVQRLTFIADYMKQHYPNVELSCINHGTAGKPTPNYGVRFFDLPEFAPTNLGVSVHLLMFYDLERPAPVYGNTDFRHTLAWIRRQAPLRRITYYPEASWWLTFDLPVPLYLAPVTLEARQHDIDLLRPLLADRPDATSGVMEHHLFSSGQEWGYWMIDWCFGRMSFDLAYTAEACFADFAARFQDGADIAAVLREVTVRQGVDMHDAARLALLVGSDDATETARDAGIVFHPLPPAPAAVLSWSDAEVARFRARALDPLRDLQPLYSGWAGRVDRLIARQRKVDQPWLREVRDGLAIFGLRAAHAVEVYDTALALRAALNANDHAAVDTARAGVERARAITERARAIVTAREADYRYPAELTSDGDEAGKPGAVKNRTVYSYRYLSRTHRLFYWTRPDTQLAQLFGEGLELVRPSQRMGLLGQPLEVGVLADGVSDLAIDWGDGARETALAPHSYAAHGLFSWHLTARHSRGSIDHSDAIAVVGRHFRFPKGSLEVLEPSGANLLNGVLPGFEVGLGSAAGDFMALGRVDSGSLTAQGGLVRRARSGQSSGPEDLTLELKNIGPITIKAAVLEVSGAGAGARLDVRGLLGTDQVIDLLVSVGGFNRDGARELIAGILGYPPDQLPAMVSFHVGAAGAEQ